MPPTVGLAGPRNPLFSGRSPWVASTELGRDLGLFILSQSPRRGARVGAASPGSGCRARIGALPIGVCKQSTHSALQVQGNKRQARAWAGVAAGRQGQSSTAARGDIPGTQSFTQAPSAFICFFRVVFM